MASYYYLMSSLPMLRSDGDMPFRYDTFLEMCRSCVSHTSYERLENLTVNSSEGPLIEEWAAFYGALADELASQRSARLGKSRETSTVCDENTARTVADALHAKNPLEAENLLLKLEFEQLDELIGIHAFDEYALNGYALKLKLLERQTVFDKTRGKAECKRLLDNLRQQIMSI